MCDSYATFRLIIIAWIRLMERISFWLRLPARIKPMQTSYSMNSSVYLLLALRPASDLALGELCQHN